MSHHREVPPTGGTANHVDGDVSGSAVQAQVIHGGVHFHQPSPVVSLPYRAGVPPQQAAAFQGRVKTTRLLVQALESGNTAVLSGQQWVHTGVVSGLGGVGKTQIALDYAQQRWTAGEIDLWIWVTAGSREAIVFSYARLTTDLTGRDHPDPEQGAQRLLEWLAGSSARWLVVLDDVQNPADLHGLWPPATPAGQVVVTTRRRDAALRGHGRCLVQVEVFTPGEAEAYLQAALADQPLLAVGAAELAAELGYLPLALAQAAAYMRDRSLSCTDYHRRWTNRRRNLASLLPELDGLPDEHHATVATTWSLSVEQANQLEPAGIAGTLLEVASMLDPNGIPATVFTTPAVIALLAGNAAGEVDAEQARDGLGCLHRLNLITLDGGPDLGVVRVHALVQRATRDPMRPPRLATLARVAGDALAAIWPDPERDDMLGQVLRANTDALAAAAGEHLWGSGVHAVLFRAGGSLGERGLVTEAGSYFHQLHITASQQLGPDHPDTLVTRHTIAYWRGEAGDPAGAATAFEQLLTDHLRIQGPDHPHTMDARHNIAYLRGQVGDPAGAATAFEQLLTDRERVLGLDHPDVLITRHNLARWRGEAGDPASAVTAFEQLLIDRTQALGPNHPHTLTTRANLARWRGEAGDSAGAVTAFEQLLTDRERILGPEHPHTLSTRHSIAYWRGQAGDPAGAVTALQQLLTDRMQVLGPDHPHTLITRANLARWRGETGDPARAVTAFEQLLTDHVRVLGPAHPHTMATRHSIAYWRGQAGDPIGAVTALEQLLTDRVLVLGPDHPHTLTTRRNLTYWRDRASERTIS